MGMGRGRGEMRGIGPRPVGGSVDRYDQPPNLRVVSIAAPVKEPRASEEEWTPPPQNTRARGLYDPNNPRGTVICYKDEREWIRKRDFSS